LERSARRGRVRRGLWETGADRGGERGQRRCVEDALLGAEQRAKVLVGEDLPTPAALRALAGNHVQVHVRVGVHQERMIVLVRFEQLLADPRVVLS
jgi:hypothetical protein